MTERGTFAVDRGVFEHPLFASCKPYSRLDAWLWMLAEASWKERARDIGGRIITLQRGEFAASVRYMAEAWGWSKSAVGRYLDRLKALKMIRSKSGTESGTGALVVTICNYDAFQPSGNGKRDSDRDSSGTAAGQIKKGNKGINTPIAPKGAGEGRGADDGYGNEAHPLYREFLSELWGKRWAREGHSRLKAYRAYRRLSQADRLAVCASIEGYAKHLESTRPEARFRPMLQSWLNSRGWEADGPTTEAAAPSPDWRKWVAAFKANGKWLPALGPEPGQPGCRVPPEFLIAVAESGRAA